jgi:hypothetical protein
VSTLRKTVLATAIIGAGLASTTGSAFATECGHDGDHHKSHETKSSSSNSSSCSNSFAGKTGASKTFLGALNGSQGAIGANVCDVLSHNNVLNNNKVDLFGGIV